MTNHVDHPQHYNRHPSGIECIDLIEWMPFNLGNAVKYLWRAGLKSEDTITDLRKAKWYAEREQERVIQYGCNDISFRTYFDKVTSSPDKTQDAIAAGFQPDIAMAFVWIWRAWSIDDALDRVVCLSSASLCIDNQISQLAG